MLNPVTPFPIDHDPAFDDLTAAILDEWGKPAVWTPHEGEPVTIRAYPRRFRTRHEAFGSLTAVVTERTSALVAAADVQGIAQGDSFDALDESYEVGEVIPDGSAFVRLLLRRTGQ